MIISHKYKFIFLKTNKTAGTSVEIALSKFCGDKDIITPITPGDEVIRRELGCRGPQNCFAPFSDYTWKDFVRLITRGKRKLRFYNHISAKEVKKYISEEIWNNYYKFCIERNPWERVMSHYFYRYGTGSRHRTRHGTEQCPTLSEHLDSKGLVALKRHGCEVYTIDGTIVVDKVCLYENLDEELENIRVHLGLPERLALPRAKVSNRSGKRNRRDIFSSDDREKIAKLFSKEISWFGYQF